MKQFTYLFDFQHVSETGRRWAMHEFAQLGAKHLVLTDTLIAMIMQNPTLQKTLADELAGEGLTFVDAHSPFGKERDLLTPYAESRPQMLARHRLAMQIAADLGVDTITIHVGNPNWFDTNVFPLNKSMELIRDALDALLPVAEDLGLTICIENIWFPTSTPDKLLEIKSFFPTDALGFTYDAGHANLMDKGRNYDESNAQKGWAASGFANVPWEDKALEKMLPHVVNCHLHDNYGQKDEHRCPGHGNIDWPHILGLLKTAPRLRNLQSEVIPVTCHEAIGTIVAAFRERLAAVNFATDA